MDWVGKIVGLWQGGRIFLSSGVESTNLRSHPVSYEPPLMILELLQSNLWRIIPYLMQTLQLRGISTENIFQVK